MFRKTDCNARNFLLKSCTENVFVRLFPLFCNGCQLSVSVITELFKLVLAMKQPKTSSATLHFGVQKLIWLSDTIEMHFYLTASVFNIRINLRWLLSLLLYKSLNELRQCDRLGVKSVFCKKFISRWILLTKRADLQNKWKYWEISRPTDSIASLQKY